MYLRFAVVSGHKFVSFCNKTQAFVAVKFTCSSAAAHSLITLITSKVLLWKLGPIQKDGTTV